MAGKANKGMNVDGDDTASLLHNYFALSHSVSSLYEQWAASDPNFARRAPAFTGIRILNQDAWEALVAFICSSNNNISRISQMVQKLCTHYGPYIETVDGEKFHDFPSPEALSGDKVESHLRELGFGYRAKYIAETACMLATGFPKGWLLQLRNPDCSAFDAPRSGAVKKDGGAAGTGAATYRAAHDALLQLPGVGPKVADCVCLMGLGWGEAVPIDTHVWQIAQRDYNFGKGAKTKTLTKIMYDAVGDHFRKIWGPQAGWAQSVLFTANLKSFAEQASSAAKRTVVVGTTEVAKVAAVPSLPSPNPEATLVQVDAALRQGDDNTTITAPAPKRKRRAPKLALEDETKSGKLANPEPGVRRTSKRLRPSGM